MTPSSGALRVDIVTLFPEFFPAPLSTGLLGRALGEGYASVNWVDPRKLTLDPHRRVDAAPYGGGAGMLMKVEPLAAAIRVVRDRGRGPVVLLSPRGRALRQRDLRGWASEQHLGLVCGRYEGFDERIGALVDDEVSLGDYVLTGGEYAALAILDGVVRLLPGTLGNPESAPSDSFSDGLLEAPQYTRPEHWEGHAVPGVLLGGHHGEIADWRRRESLRVTRARRPDLLAERILAPADAQRLKDLPIERRVMLAVDLRTLGRGFESWALLRSLGAAYGLERVWVVAPDPLRAADVRTRLGEDDRVSVVSDWSELRRALPRSFVVLSGAGSVLPLPSWSHAAARDAARSQGVCLVAAPEQGTEESPASGCLPSPRQAAHPAGLDPFLALALTLDRILGES